MPRVPDVPCRSCGVMLWTGRTSLAEPICRPCRRLAIARCEPCRANPHRPACVSCINLRDRDRKRRKAGIPDRQVYTCEGCGSTFDREPARGQAPKWCSEACGNAIRAARRRAREAAAYVTDVNRRATFERDGWICQLCRKPVDRSKAWPHPQSAVLDHIVPLSAGGTHEPANVQCAHNRCNTVKGAKAHNDQLRLIG